MLFDVTILILVMYNKLRAWGHDILGKYVHCLGLHLSIMCFRLNHQEPVVYPRMVPLWTSKTHYTSQIVSNHCSIVIEACVWRQEQYYVMVHVCSTNQLELMHQLILNSEWNILILTMFVLCIHTMQPNNRDTISIVQVLTLNQLKTAIFLWQLSYSLIFPVRGLFMNQGKWEHWNSQQSSRSVFHHWLYSWHHSEQA